MNRAAWLSVAALILCTRQAFAADEPAKAAPVKFATGETFRKAIGDAISGDWDHVGLRTIVRAIEEARHVAILTDRRLDPTAELRVSAAVEPLGDFLERLAVGSRGSATVVGNTVYLGPPDSTAKLRTLVALRMQELKSSAAAPDARRIEHSRETFRWDDLDRPAEILARLSEEYGVGVEGLELVPHDLWAGAVLPETNVIEALSLVLIQFDLTFGWTERGKGVRIEHVPERVEIELPHDPPRGVPANTALAAWKEKLPDLEARVEKGKVVVTGTWEQHEVVERIRRGASVPDKTAAREGGPLPPLSHQRYTGTILNKPASEVMQDLGTRKRGEVKFEYDLEELKNAGINLDALVSLNLKNATIEELLKGMFDPLGVTFEIVDRTVKLKPKPK
ncbi:MAG: STN domain-containing protein [Deltaproteobacteria bacterium]